MDSVRTSFLVIPAIGATSSVIVNWSEVPGYDMIKKTIGGYFDEPFEHVSVLWESEPRDMFVGETSSINGRHIRNTRATEIYRNNWLYQYPDTDPESLSAISGPAILFSRRIWF